MMFNGIFMDLNTLKLNELIILLYINKCGEVREERLYPEISSLCKFEKRSFQRKIKSFYEEYHYIRKIVHQVYSYENKRTEIVSYYKLTRIGKKAIDDIQELIYAASQ